MNRGKRNHPVERVFFARLGTVVAILGASLAVVPRSEAESAGPAFTESSEFGSGSTIPVAWGDYNADGDLDLAVGNFGGSNELYVNNGDGTFTGGLSFGAGSTFATVWGDPDNDGDLDMAVGNGQDGQNFLYINNGDNTFSEKLRFGQGSTNAMAWGDVDNDGNLDLAVGNGILNPDEQNVLYINLGNGTFAALPRFGTGQTDSLVWGDCDGDGDLDLAVGNGGFNSSPQQNFLYVNEGGFSFTEVAEFGTGDTASVAWHDYDNDGDLDLAVGNWDNGQNLLYVNNGDCTFVAEPQFGARDTNAIAWGDYNNDGHPDLAVGNGDFGSADQNYLYVNNGDGTFAEQAEFGLGSTDAVAWGDFDGDGDLDLASGNEHSPTQNYLYENNLSGGTYLAIHVVGHRHDHGSGFSNRDGIGAKVSIYEAGFLGDGAGLLGFREITAHGGFSAQNSIDASFGLAGATLVDVRIVWPGSENVNTVTDIAGVSSNQRLTVHEAEPLPVGSCCEDDGECRVNSMLQCSTGTWSEGGACVPNTCPGFLVAPGEASAPHDSPKHRYLSIDSTTNGSKEVGIEATLVQMARCAGNLERACTEDSDCDSGATAPCVEHPDVGSTWWVQAPQDEPLGCLPGPCGPTDQFARVDATPHFQVWDLTTLHIGDCEIIPVATYELRACLPPDGVICGDAYTIGTISQPFISPGFRGNYGDVAGNVEGTEFAPPDGIANIVDVSAYQLTAQNYGTANTPQTHPTWVDLNGLGAGQPPQYILNVADLGQILKALQGNVWTDDPGNLNPGSCP